MWTVAANFQRTPDLVGELAAARRSVYIHQMNLVNSRNDFGHDDSHEAAALSWLLSLSSSCRVNTPGLFNVSDSCGVLLAVFTMHVRRVQRAAVSFTPHTVPRTVAHAVDKPTNTMDTSKPADASLRRVNQSVYSPVNTHI